MTATNPNPAPATPALLPSPAPAVDRNKQIRAMMKPFMDRPGMRELQDNLIDAAAPIEEVRAKVLAKLGQGAGPLGGSLVGDRYDFIDTSDTRPRDFLAAACDAS